MGYKHALSMPTQRNNTSALSKRNVLIGIAAVLGLMYMLSGNSSAVAYVSGGDASDVGVRPAGDIPLDKREKARVVIIGSGVTGLGAAYRLFELEHADWDVYEMDSISGGLARSVTNQDGFTFDHGVHVLFSHFGYFDSLLDHVLPVDEWQYHNRSSPIYMYDRFVGYPLQNNIWQLPPGPLMECLEGLIEVHDAVASGVERPKPRNFLEWILQSFGKGIVKFFMAPYNFKVWAHPPVELNANWVGERVATIDLSRILSNLVNQHPDVHWGPNALFRYPSRGSGVVWENVFKALPRERFHFGTEVKEVNVDNPNGKFLVMGDGSKVPFDYLISTMPINKMLQRIKGRPDLAAWGREEGSFKYQTVNLVGIGVEGQVPEAWSTPHWVYFPEDVYPFYRITILSNFSPYMVAKPGKQYSILVEVSESKYRKVNQQTIVDEVIEGLRKATVLPADAEIATRWHERFEYGYPVPYVERDFHVHRANKELLKLGIWSRGRFGNWKYEVANQDHSCMLGVQAVDNVLFDTYEEILHEPNVVNMKKGERTILPPKHTDRWDVVLVGCSSDTGSWLPPLLRNLDAGNFDVRVFIYDSCASTASDNAWQGSHQVTLTSVASSQSVARILAKHALDHYEQLSPVTWVIPLGSGTRPSHPIAADFAVTENPRSRPFHVWEQGTNTDPSLCSFYRLFHSTPCPANVPKAAVMHVARGTFYRLLPADYQAAISTL